MSNWYSSLFSRLEVFTDNATANKLKVNLLEACLSVLPGAKMLDVSVSDDVLLWFETIFSPWFSKLSVNLVNSEGINEVLTALNVARSYYETKVDQELLTSTKDVYRYKVRICEDLAGLIINTFRNPSGENIYVQTEASSYSGSTPEPFNWPGTVLSYHQILETVNIEGEKTQECSGKKDFLPWVITAAFGLIAWSAAASKK